MVLDSGDLRHLSGEEAAGDTGCDLARSCLDCPFERCLQEEPGGVRRYLLVQRDAHIAGQFHDGKGTYQIARDLGVSRRTVQRALRRQRKSPPLSFSPARGERDKEPAPYLIRG